MWPFTKSSRPRTETRSVLEAFDNIHYYAAVGGFTTSWAGLEMSLDYANTIIMAFAKGHEIQDDLPISLKPKITFFRKAHSRLADISTFKDEGLALASRVTALVAIRHDMIHGIHGLASGILPDGARQFYRLTYKGAGFTTTNKPYSAAAILEAGVTAGRLRDSIVAHATSIASLLAPEDQRHNFLG